MRVFLQWLLWLVPYALCVLVIILAVGKRRLKDYPYFFSYLGVCVLDTAIIVAIGLWVSDSQTLYERLASCSSILESVLELAAIYELSVRLFLSHALLGPSLKPLCKWTLGGLLLFASIGAALLPQNMPWMRLETNVSFFNNVIDLGLLLSLALIAAVLGISWPKMAAGIALGLGISAAGAIVGDFVFGQFGRVASFASDLLRLGSFHVSALVWMTSIFMRETPPPLSSQEVPLSSFERTAAELSNILGWPVVRLWFAFFRQRTRRRSAHSNQ